MKKHIIGLLLNILAAFAITIIWGFDPATIPLWRFVVGWVAAVMLLYTGDRIVYWQNAALSRPESLKGAKL